MRDYATNPIPRRGWAPFIFRAIVASTAIVLLLIWVTYQSEWIRLRRAVVLEDKMISDRLGNYACGVTCDDLPPLGSTLSQKLLILLGEPARSRVYVYYVLADPDHYVLDGYEVIFEAADYAKVKRAQRLFPEAEIVAVYIQRHDVHNLERVKGLITE